MSKLQTNTIQHTANGAAVFTLPQTDGSAGQVLRTDGSGNLSWVDDQKGKILQVVSVSDSVRESTGSITLTNASTYYDTPFTVTITPSASSSKILLMGHVMGEATINDYLILWSIKRAISGGATTNIQAPTVGNRPPCISVIPQGIYISEQTSTPATITFAGLLDSPNTTSAVTYTFQVRAPQNSSVGFYYNRSVGDSNAADNERGLSWITAQEISG